MAIQGLSIIERSQPSIGNTQTSINRVCLAGFATPVLAANANQLIAIADSADFALKFTGASDLLVASIRAIFRNYPAAKLSFIAAKDPAIALAGDKGHLVYALKQIGNKPDLEMHIICIPELGAIALQNDRTTVYTEAEALCVKLGWIHFFNTATTTDTPAKAVTESALYSSPLGHSSLYYGMLTDLEDKAVPLAVIATAIALQRFKDNPYNPPAGVRYPIKGIKAEPNYVELAADYDELRAKGINCTQLIPTYGRCLWGARTLAKEARFTNINTRVAMSIVSRQLTLALVPQLFEPSDPQGYTRGEVLRLITSLLEQAYADGGLSGNTPQDAYRIVERDVPAAAPASDPVTVPPAATNPAPTTPVAAAAPRNLRRIKISAYCRFVETLEMIEIELINVDLIPTGNV